MRHTLLGLTRRRRKRGRRCYNEAIFEGKYLNIMLNISIHSKQRRKKLDSLGYTTIVSEFSDDCSLSELAS